MKYLKLPISLLRFWYPESLVVFLRALKHTILYLEEDLAVRLMLRLLFVPLFHDSSITGRFLSFWFRVGRVVIGLLSFIGITLLVIVMALFWFLLPALAVILQGDIGLIAKILFFSGVVLFVNHIVSHPPKKVWQIKKAEDIWQASWISRQKTDYLKLLKTPEVKNLLLYLEQVPENFANFTTVLDASALEKLWSLGRQLKVPYFGAEHFFVTLLLNFPNIDKELLKLSLKPEDFIDTLDFLNRKREVWRTVFVWDEDFHVKHLKGVNRGWLGVPTPNLDAVTEDLTRKASREDIPEFVGRQTIVSQVINILSLERGRNVCLVGEPGAGKSELVLYLAKLIVSGDAPASLATKRLVSLDITRLLAGVTSQGELAEKIKNIFEDVKNCGNIIVFVDEIHDLGIGEAGKEFNLYSLLLPYIEGSDFQFISTTETGNYTRILEKNGSFARLFTKIELPPATVTDTVHILKNQAIEHEHYKKIKTSIPAIRSIADLTNQYIHDLVLPDGALQVFEQSLVSVDDGWIKKSVVEKVIQSKTSVPVGEIEGETKKQLLGMEDIIHQKMIDQEEAVSVVAKTLRRAATDLRDKNRPIGSFLFVGPTGVGKTELAKILSEVYFQGRGQFLRFDMSEYQRNDSVNRLIGESGEEGILTESVRQHPYSLILLDEFEKADDKILTLFLQVLDDGRLTSGSGRTVDFTNTIIIATSNAGSLTIAKGIQSGMKIEQLNTVVRDELLKIFRPELVNRFDEVVLFKPLSQSDLQKIVSLKLESLQNQLKEKGYLIEFGSEIVQELAQKGYDPVLGARPLRRLIQDTLEAKLSVAMLEGKLPKGEKITVGRELLV